jgi:hypothetical protein
MRCQAFVISTFLVSAICQADSGVGIGKLKAPSSESGCLAVHGKWHKDFFGNMLCDLRTSDAGKRCTSSSQCGGACIGPADAIDGSATTGICSDRLAHAGTIVFVERGRAKRVIVE